MNEVSQRLDEEIKGLISDPFNMITINDEEEEEESAEEDEVSEIDSKKELDVDSIDSLKG